MKKSFVFYASWYEAIVNLPRDVQGDVLTAIVEYGLSGETTEQLKPITRTILALIKPLIDANNQRFENGQKGAEFGKLGGRPKKKNPKETPTKPQDGQNETPNVNVNVNKSSIEDIKKESPYGDEKESELSSCTHANPDFIKFNEWLLKNAPYCADTKHFAKQITETQFLRLKQKYTGKQIADTISQIENRKDLRKRYTDLYRTALNWLKKEYGD